MKNNTKFTKAQLLTALRVKKQLPTPMTKEELAKGKLLLTKRLTVSEAFDIIELMTYPYNSEMKRVSARLSVANMVLDKVAKKAGIKQHELDKMYGDSTKAFKKANEEEIKHMKQQFKMAAQKMQKQTGDK